MQVYSHGGVEFLSTLQGAAANYNLIRISIFYFHFGYTVQQSPEPPKLHRTFKCRVILLYLSEMK